MPERRAGPNYLGYKYGTEGPPHGTYYRYIHFRCRCPICIAEHRLRAQYNRWNQHGMPKKFYDPSLPGWQGAPHWGGVARLLLEIFHPKHEKGAPTRKKMYAQQREHGSICVPLAVKRNEDGTLTLTLAHVRSSTSLTLAQMQRREQSGSSKSGGRTGRKSPSSIVLNSLAFEWGQTEEEYLRRKRLLSSHG